MTNCEKRCGDCANWYRLPEYVAGTCHFGYCIRRHNNMIAAVLMTGRPSAYDIEYSLYLEDTTAEETDCSGWEARHEVA